jgi:uncharacterized protein
MPKDDRFIERFSEHSRLIVPASRAFRALMSGDGSGEIHLAEISRLEDAADQLPERPSEPCIARLSRRLIVHRS